VKKGTEKFSGLTVQVKDAFFLLVRSSTKVLYDEALAKMRNDFPKALNFIEWFTGFEVQALRYDFPILYVGCSDTTYLSCHIKEKACCFIVQDRLCVFHCLILIQVRDMVLCSS